LAEEKRQRRKREQERALEEQIKAGGQGGESSPTLAERVRKRPSPRKPDAASGAGDEVAPPGQGGAWLADARRWLPFSATQISQAFSVLGVVAVLGLWYVTRRRRSALGGWERRRFPLPLFWRQPARQRAE
jgi:hypothetical protein